MKIPYRVLETLALVLISKNYKIKWGPATFALKSNMKNTLLNMN